MTFGRDPNTQNVGISPVAFIAGRIGAKIDAPTSYIDKASAAGAAIEKTGNQLDQIADIKQEIMKSLGPEANGAKGGGSIHAVPEAESPMGFKSMLIDGALTGAGFMLAGPAGVAAAGIVSAGLGAMRMMGAGSTHKGTIHLGELSSQGMGTMGLNEKMSGKTAGGYTDVLGGEWQSDGQAIKIASAPAAPMPGPAPNAQKLKLQEAVAEANQMFTPKQMLDAVYAESKEEKALQVARSGLIRRMDEDGRDTAGVDGMNKYESFQQSLQGTPAPKKALNVGMVGTGGMSGPGMA